VLKHFSITPPENFGGAEKSTENSGSQAKNFFCSMYEMSQRHPVWVAENHVNPCNSVHTEYEIVIFNKSNHLLVKQMSNSFNLAEKKLCRFLICFTEPFRV
jgi:hypothetical protein